jgi:trimethylamine:corrinoid methyltransferase-like protein
MLQGMKIHTETLATGFYEGVNFKGGDFLKQKITMQLFQKEQNMPGAIIDRDSIRGWKASGSMDMFDRAKVRVAELLASYRRPELDPDQVSRLHAFVLDLSKQTGVETLPIIEDYEPA